MMKAGSGVVDIIPPQGLELGGYPHYPRYNTGAHDPLYAGCLYLSNGETEIAIVTLDLLFFSKVHVQSVRARVQQAAGIPAENIMISTIHTHSGPWASGRLDIESLEAGIPQPKEYVEELKTRLVELIISCKQNAFEAEFTSGTAICGAESGIGGNRRIPGGPADPLVSVMAVCDMDKKVRGVFVNYTLHPTFIHEWSTVCTADYPAYIRQQLCEMEPGTAVLFAQGASGNQSSRYYRQGESFDEAERVGRTLGKAAHSVLDKAVWTSELTLKTANANVELELRSFGEEAELEKKVAHDKAIYEDLYARYGKSTNRDEYYLWQNANLKLLGSEDQLGYVRMQNRGTRIELLEDEAPAEIQLLAINNTLVVGVPGEVFVEYGLYIKAMAGFETVIFNELANGCLPGYLYTPESLVTGGYETDTSMLGEKFGRHLVDDVLDLIDTIHES